MNSEIISTEQLVSLERIAAIVAKSGMGGFKTPEQATVAMLLALAEGIPLGRVIHEYHIINGRLSLRSECILARFQKAGGIIKYIEHTETCVSLTASHPKGGALTITWTIERARKAGLTSNPTWTKHPAAMLTARAITEAIRAVYPACLSGIITEEEAVEVTAPAPAPVIIEPVTLTVIPELKPTPEPRGYHITDRTSGNGAEPQTDNGTTPSRPSKSRSGSPRRGPAVSERPGVTPLSGTGPDEPARDSKTDPETNATGLVGEPENQASVSPAPQASEALPNPPHQDAAKDEFTPEPESKRPSPNSASLYHPLDPVLAHHDQDKLTAFLLKQGFIAEGQNYKWCGPNATSRILKQFPSFLKAAGLEEVPA